MRLRKNKFTAWIWFLLSIAWLAWLGVIIYLHSIGVETDYYMQHMFAIVVIIVQDLLIGVMSMRNDGIVG